MQRLATAWNGWRETFSRQRPRMKNLLNKKFFLWSNVTNSNSPKCLTCIWYALTSFRMSPEKNHLSRVMCRSESDSYKVLIFGFKISSKRCNFTGKMKGTLVESLINRKRESLVKLLPCGRNIIRCHFPRQFNVIWTDFEKIQQLTSYCSYNSSKSSLSSVEWRTCYHPYVVLPHRDDFLEFHYKPVQVY